MDLGSRDAHPLQRKPCGAHPLQRRLCSAHPLQRRQCFAHPLQRRQCGAHMPTLYRDDSVVPTLLQECDSSLTVYCTVLSVLSTTKDYQICLQGTVHLSQKFPTKHFANNQQLNFLYKTGGFQSI